MTDDDPLTRFEQAARRARDEPVPALDVTDAVMARVADEPEALVLDPSERTTWLCLAASIAVALTAAWIGADEWATLNDPFGSYVAAMTTETP